MKKLLLVCALAMALAPSLANAQCNGVFPPSTLCGNLSGVSAIPGPFPSSGSIVGPVSSTLNGLPLFANTLGTQLKDGAGLTIAGNYTWGGTQTYSGANTFNSSVTFNSDWNAISATSNHPQLLIRNTTTDALPAFVLFQKSRSGGAVLNGDTMGQIQAWGFANAAFQPSAAINFTIDGAPVGSNVPSRQDFYVSNNAAQLNLIPVSMRATNVAFFGNATLDPQGNYSASSATSGQPNYATTNSTADSNASVLQLNKNRTGGNTLNTDFLGRIFFNGFASASQQLAATISAQQNAASSGANIPTQITIGVTNTTNNDTGYTFTGSNASGNGWLSPAKGTANGIGYTTGAGCAVTQATSKATAVTCNGMAGDITLNGASLNGATIATFQLNNTSTVASDNYILNHITTGTFGSYTLNVHGCTAGNCQIDVRNATGGALSEAIVIRFTILRSANN